MAKTMASLQALPSSLLPRAWSRALIPFPFPFERLPRRLEVFRFQIFSCEDLQSAFLCSLFCSICMSQLFMNSLVTDGKSLSVECCLETENAL